MLLLGVVVIITTVLYIYFSDQHSRDAEKKVRSAAAAISSTPDLQTLGRGRLTGKLVEFKQLYDLDVLMAVPVTDLTGPKLASPGDTDLRSSPRLGEQRPAGDLSDELPEFPDSTVQAAANGNVTTVYLDTSDGGTLYSLAPMTPTPTGFERMVVVTGVHRSTVRESFRPVGNLLIASGAFTFVLGTGGTWLTSRGLKRVTGDYGTRDLARLIGYYQSVLQSINDGLILSDRSNGIILYNQPARTLLDLPQTQPPLPFTQLTIPDKLRSLIESGRYARDEIHYTTSRVLLVNQQPARIHADGDFSDLVDDTWVTTVRDHTELRQLTGELTSIRSFSDSLRSQTHEFANRLHTIASLIETGHTDKALEFATEEVTHTQNAPETMLGGFDQPVIGALVYTKLAQAKEERIELTVDVSELESAIPGDERDLVTILGNLLDNAFDAVCRPDLDPKRRRVHLTMSGSPQAGYQLSVRDDGHGIPDDNIDSIFERGWSTKHDGIENDTGDGCHNDSSRGVGLDVVVQAITRMGGAIDVDGGIEANGEACREPGSDAANRPPEFAGALAQDIADQEFRGAEFSVWLPGSPLDRRVGQVS